MNQSEPSSVSSRMMLRFLIRVVLLLLLALRVWTPAAGQEPGRTSPPDTGSESQSANQSDPTDNQVSSPPEKRIQLVGPDTYILLDADGKPQPMPGMTYEDFLAAWKKINQPPALENPPGYTIESIHFKGRVGGQRAELDFEANVRLLADGRAEVPIGLASCILQGMPAFEHIASEHETARDHDESKAHRDGDDYLTFDAEHGGFVAHLSGRSHDRRTISFRLLVPLVKDGTETTLPLDCPRALSSNLEVTIDTTVSELRASTGTILSQESAANGATQVKVAGPVGLFRLAWQTATKDSPSLASVVHALGSVRVTIDGRGIRSDARLTVRSFGGGFDQLRIRLPAGAQLIPSRNDLAGRQDTKYRVRVEPDVSSGNQGETRDQIAVIELPEKQQGPLAIDLSTEQSAAADNRVQEINLAGFEVLGAVRQFGDIALHVADDWQARWTIGAHVRQVDPVELDASLQTPRPTAAFQYDRQPWSLLTSVTARQLRVHVTPKYELECLPEETRLTLRLAYQVFGARAFEFRVDLNGWEITGDPVESGGLVDQDRIVVTPEGTLVLPLAQASSRRAEVAFTLRRVVQRDAPRLELPLPAPQADSVGTGALMVRAAPDIELLPDLANSTGLVTAPNLPAESAVAGDENGKLHFRTLLPAATFVSDRLNRPRDIGTETSTQIAIQGSETYIDQRINYNVRFEPIGELTLEMPDELFDGAEHLELHMVAISAPGEAKSDESGTPLHINSGNEDSAALSLLGTRHVRVVLPQPRIGAFAVRARYRLPTPPVAVAGVDWLLPLAQPVDGKLSGQQATIRCPRNIAVALSTASDESNWQMPTSASAVDARSPEYVFTASEPEPYLPLVVRSGRADSGGGTNVERAWLQTWFSKDLQQNRAAFRFRTAGDQVSVELPPDADEFELLVDSEPAEIVSHAQGRITVRLPTGNGLNARAPGNGQRKYTLELRYRNAYRHNLVARHRLTPPQIEGSIALAQVYWHVVVPGDEHIVYSQQQLTSASQWQWLGSFFGMQPVKSQADLEAWSGASEQPSPPGGHSEYLFTSLLPVASIEVATMPRWLIVFAASAIVLALVAAWNYLPVPHRKWFLAVIALGLAAGAILHPVSAALLAQAATIGIVLAVASVFLARVFKRPARTPLMPLPSPSSQRMVAPRTDSMLMPPVLSVASTAPTVSLRTSDSER